MKRKKGEVPIKKFGTTPGPQIRFCSDECRTNYHNQKRAKVEHPHIKCEVCGAAITKRRIEQRFCSSICRMKYWQYENDPSHETLAKVQKLFG
jgi:predicted nucleic acid-binding Zn ribbon protein